MAQYNLGKCFPVVKGNYSPQEIYEVLDIVFYETDGCSYICKKDGNSLPSDTTRWMKLSARGAAGEGSSSGITEDQVNQIIRGYGYQTAQDVENKIGIGSLTITYGGNKIGSFGANATTDETINIPRPTIPVMHIDRDTLKGQVDATIDNTKPLTVYEADTPLSSLTLSAVTGGTQGYADTEIWFSVADEKFRLNLTTNIKPLGELGKSFMFTPGEQYIITLHMGFARLDVAYDPIKPANETV